MGSFRCRHCDSFNYTDWVSQDLNSPRHSFSDFSFSTGLQPRIMMYPEHLPSAFHRHYRSVTRRQVGDALLPCLIWLRKYRPFIDLPFDLISGLSVGLMVVPQAISYAALAGLPAQYGLYTGVLREGACWYKTSGDVCVSQDSYGRV